MRFIHICLYSIFSLALKGQDTTYICLQEDVLALPMGNLNTKSIEFSPTYYQSGLVYVVAREKNKFIDPKTGRAYFDLMYADIGPDGSTSKSVSFSPNIRTQYHEGPCTFNAEGTEMFFTRSNLAGGVGVHDEKGQVQLKIYRATKGPEDWQEITELPFSSDAYASVHPALSADGLHLVFASDMPGGFGGMDLYVVNRGDGQWSAPVNLGPSINTNSHEVFPYWHPAGYLFFSSDGHAGKGGLDLFVTSWQEEKNFTGLQRLEMPFNSSRDDLGLIVSADGTSGYFASSRKPTKGKDDLYGWTSQHSIFCKSPGATLDRMIVHEMNITDEQQMFLENASVWLIPMGKEGPSRHTSFFSTELAPHPEKDGSFSLRWNLTSTLSDGTADARSNSMGKASLDVNEKNNYLLVVQRDGYEPFVELMTGDVLPETIMLKKREPITAPCVQTLFTVFNEKGDIRLNGAKVQITGNCLKAPVNLYADDDGMTKACLPKGCAVKGEFIQEAYASHAFTFTPAEEDEHWKIYLKRSEGLTSPAAPIESGTVIVLDNIYYDFNKSAIRKGDAAELIALANILKQYPDLTIELTSHTDTRGSAEYNLELAEKRSESSKAYLVLQGISASRVVTKAAGESQPRNKCLDNVPCTEAEHQFNRRTEVRIINPAQGMEIRYKAEG